MDGGLQVVVGGGIRVGGQELVRALVGGGGISTPDVEIGELTDDEDVVRVELPGAEKGLAGLFRLAHFLKGQP